MRQADDSMLVAGQSRLAHITGRVVRLHAVAHEHAGVDRLLEKIKEFDRQVERARDSMGSVHEGASALTANEGELQAIGGTQTEFAGSSGNNLAVGSTFSADPAGSSLTHPNISGKRC